MMIFWLIFILLTWSYSCQSLNDYHEFNYLITAISSTIPSRRPSRAPTFMPTISAMPPTSQYSALYDLYEATGGGQWRWSIQQPGIPWNFSQAVDAPSNPCADLWQGVTCNSCSSDTNCDIINLDLNNHNLMGTLPDSLGNLTSLQGLDLHGNRLFGTIPLTLQQLILLQSLLLDHNKDNGLIGTIPDIFYNMSSMRTVDLSHNNITGTLPPSLYHLTNLISLVLENNQLSGTLSSSQLSNWKKLQTLNVGQNQFRGSVPSTLGKLVNLQTLTLRINQFSSSLPPSISSLIRLQTIQIGENHFHGPLPSNIQNLQSLEVFDAQRNAFTGPLPIAFTFLRKLQSLILSHNFISSSLPSNITLLSNLRDLMMFRNLLTGTLPNMSHCQNLTFITVGDNHLTGPMYHIDNENMFLLVLSNNLMTGMMPFPNASRLTTLAVDNNYFTGSLPAILPVYHSKLFNDSLNYIDLYYLNVSSNYISGTLPTWLVNTPFLAYAYLFDNCFYGKIPDSRSYTHLNSLYLGDNFLTGTIPKSIGSIEMIALQLLNNYLYGSIPIEIFNNTKLKYLFLQQNQFSGSLPNPQHYPIGAKSLELMEISSNSLTGKIPDGYFTEFPQISVFSAGSNCFTGSIPSSICNSTTLTSLALDGMSTASKCRQRIFPKISTFQSFTLEHNTPHSIPNCLYSMSSLQSLHLSGNALIGNLPTTMTNISQSFQTLALSHNRLYGKIPSIVQVHPWETLDLSYNRLSGTLVEQFNDHNVTSTTTVYLDVNRLSGWIPSIFTQFPNVSVLNGNIFDCNWDESDLPQQDPKKPSYSCGSDSVNRSVYTWISVIGVIAIGYVICMTWKKSVYQPYVEPILKLRDTWLSMLTEEENSNIALYVDFSKTLTQQFTVLTVVGLIILIPFYQLLTVYQGSYEDQYIWTYSAVYLSGMGSGITLMLIFMTLLAVGYYMMYVQLLRKFPSRAKTTSIQYEYPRYQYAMYTVFIFFDVTLMILLNVAYVIGIVYENHKFFIGASKLMLAIFKLVWNDIVLWNMLAWGKHWLGARSAILATEEQRWKSYRSIDRNDMMVIIGLVMFNNLIAPCISVAIINPQCFYNAFIAADSLNSSFNYCISFIALLNDNVLFCTKYDFVTTKYEPPFIYNYNCASLLPVTYVEVYIYMMLMIGVVLPVTKLIVKYLYDYRLHPTSSWYQWLDRYLPWSYRFVRATFPVEVIQSSKSSSNSVSGSVQSVGVVSEDGDRVSTSIYHTEVHHISNGSGSGSGKGSNSGCHMDGLLFDKHRFIVRLLSFVAIFLSLGMLFPILACITTIAMFVWIKSEQILLGKMLYDAKIMGLRQYREVLEEDCKDMIQYYFPNIMLLIWIASGLYACLVFDTIGDASNYRIAITPALLVMLFPSILWWYYRNMGKEKDENEVDVGSGSSDVSVAVGTMSMGIELSSATQTKDGVVAFSSNPLHESSSKQIQ